MWSLTSPPTTRSMRSCAASPSTRSATWSCGSPTSRGASRRPTPICVRSPRRAAARARVEAAIAHSLAVANASRTERALGQATLVTAVCDGHPSEIADAWGKTARNTVFALYDAKSLAVSLRRSPDCMVDLSRLAASLGGGGHAAAAGCELPDLRRVLPEALAARIARALA